MMFDILNTKSAERTRQEIRTLIQALPGDGSDTELAELLTEGWQILNLTVSAIWVPEQRNLDGSVQRGYLLRERIVTLGRTVEKPLQEMAIPIPVSVPFWIGDPDDQDDETDEDIDESETVEVTPEPTASAREPLRGVVMTEAEAMEAQAMALRPDPEDVTFSFAVRSGLYSAEEIKAIGNREAREAGLRAALEVQARQQANRVTYGWQFRLPQLVEVEQ